MGDIVITKKSIFNVLTDIIPHCIISILGFIKIKLFIDVFGPELNGILQLFAQILGYLSLFESGLGVGVVFLLYKPFKDNNINKINELLKGASIIYKRIALVIILLSLFILFRIDLLITNNPFEISFIQTLFLLDLIANLFGYFYIGYILVFEADHSKYRLNIYRETIYILKMLIEIVMIIYRVHIIYILIFHVAISFITALISKCLALRYYPWLDFKNTIPDFSSWKQTKHLFPSRLSNIVMSNTDIVVISAFLGPISVSIYTVYNYIIVYLDKIINKITNATIPGFGNLFISENKKHVEKVFNEYIVISTIIGTSIFIPLFISFNPFIKLWVGKSLLLSTVEVLLFSLILYLRIIKIPLVNGILGLGLFKEIKIPTMIEAVTNIILSIILIKYYGIRGALLATFFSTLVFGFIFQLRIFYKETGDIKDRLIFLIKNKSL